MVTDGHIGGFVSYINNVIIGDDGNNLYIVVGAHRDESEKVYSIIFEKIWNYYGF